MAKISLTVISIIANEYGYLLTLQNKVASTNNVAGLGDQSHKTQATYKLPLTTLAKPQAELLNTVVNLDLDAFDIRIKDFTVPEGDNKGEVYEIKWLYAKS